MMAKVTQVILVAMLCTVMLTEAWWYDRLASRGLPKFGGWRTLNVTDQEVQTLAAEATAHLERVRNSGKVYRLEEVVAAKSQVVRGKNFQLGLRIGETDCVREPDVDVEDCSTVAVEQCLVIVWVWQDASDFVNFTCRKYNRPMPGGEQRIDVDSEAVEQVASFAAAELASRSNGLYRVQHRCITKATSQVVAGLLYRLTMVVSVAAGEDGQSKSVRCKVAVSDQAWQTPRYTLHEYKCSRLIS